MVRRLATISGFLLCIGTALPLLAELPPQSPAQLEQGSDLIVTGVVKRIYTSDEARDRGMVDTRYLLEVSVEKVEKGQGAKPGETTARMWLVLCVGVLLRQDGASGSSGGSPTGGSA